MVKLNADMIAKLGPGFNKRRADETVDHYLNRLTHIYLQDKHIDGLEIIPVCKNLSVIYLYDNKLARIENFEFAPNLTHLYLHNNRIRRMENLSHLKKLTKLHLGGNCIKLVEGLENLTDLVELCIENQQLPAGEKLIFDPRCLMTLMSSLRILNIAGNRLDSLGEIGSLVNLEVLDASNNLLNDMKEMSVMLKCWHRLSNLDLSGNPICAKNKYRERIIVLASNIRVLDGKEIPELSRQFLQNWKLSKEMMNINQQQQQLKQQQLANAQLHQESQQQQQQQVVGADGEFGIIQQSSSSKYNSATMYRNGGGTANARAINAMPTYIMPEYKKPVPSAYSMNYPKSLPKSAHHPGTSLAPLPTSLNHQLSPDRKQSNNPMIAVNHFGRSVASTTTTTTTVSNKSNAHHEFESASFNNGTGSGLSTAGLAVNSYKAKTRAASSHRTADMF